MTDYSKLTVVALRAELKQRSLDTAGLKADLVQRLTDADAAGVTAPAAAEAEPEPASTGRPKRKAAGKKAEPETEPEPEPTPAPAAKGRGKRKAAVAPAPAEEEEEEEEAATPPPAKKGKKASAAVAPAASAASSKKKGGSPKVDAGCGWPNARVLDDYSATLNQTNLNANNNKFYIIQVVTNGASFYCWTRWGRVGEPGQNAMLGLGSKDDAIKQFEKKFKDKSGNNWADRDNFVVKSGKYTLLQMDHDADEEEEARLQERLDNFNKNGGVASPVKSKPAEAEKQTQPSILSPQLQDLMELLFDHAVFKQAMASFNIDVARMPLGKLSKEQVQKGYDILAELEAELKGKKRSAQINELSSRFYTLIPHSFGRSVPPPVNTLELLQKKQDLLNVLNDIEIAQDLQAKSKKKAAEKAAKAPKDLPKHPLDEKYESLKCDLELLDKKSQEHKIIEKYIQVTKSGWPAKLKVNEIYTVDRHDESQRFAEHDDLENRKLCWHGTGVAVVAAILSSGLRIMPHSGGRVGKGIYFASEHGKSSAYTGPANFKGKRQAIMFLAEVALGQEHTITRDDSSLRQAPKGFDCVVARGRQEPDPSLDVTLRLDGHDVVVPQGQPLPQPQFANSSFHQSEYLIYKESQHRIRYMIRFDWD